VASDHTEPPHADVPAGPDAALLAEIESLHLRAQLTVQGALAGMHRSQRRGASIEFSEHKLYSPGDDVRHIDWRAFAKTDRYHVKQFEDETNLTLELLVDHSGSMAFASPGLPSKLDYGRTLAGALSYLALRQGDATGLTLFSGEGSEELPARATSTHLLEILRRLVSAAPQAETRLRGALDQFAQRHRKRSLVILLSDLFDPDPELTAAFRRLAAQRHDVAVLHLLDPAEVNFPYENPSLFVSMEDPRRLFVHPRTLRTAYLEEMRRFIERTSRQLAEAGVDYHCIDTGTPPAAALGLFLRARDAKVGLRRNDRT
jgi:uncharacterized protein (DUF58 family)